MIIDVIVTMFGIFILVIIVMIVIVNNTPEDPKKVEVEKYVHDQVEAAYKKIKTDYPDSISLFDPTDPSSAASYCGIKGNSIYIIKQQDVIEAFGKPEERNIDDIKNIELKVTTDKVTSLDDIIYYREIGDKTYTTETYGGEVNGGGSSLAGALVGGAIAGSTGAIIGSRQKISSSGIKSYTRTHDDRMCQIMTKNGDIRFPLDFYKILNSIIPEKEYSLVMLKKENNNKGKTNEENNIVLLREYKKLFDDGILSEEEYIKKKEELLK